MGTVMRSLIRWLLALMVLIALWLALVLSEWLPRPTAEEQAALAALAVEPESAKGERDGFAATWFMGYDVPEDQLSGLLEADLAAYNKLLTDTGSVVDFRTTAEGRFAALPYPNGQDPALCELWNDDCVQRVRSAPEATRQRLKDFAQRLDRSRWLARYDHFHYAFAPRFDSPIGALNGLSNLQLSEATLQYVDGDVDQAFATLCSDTASWRRFRSRSDILVNDMIGIAYISLAAQLYGQMLAEQPADFAAPCPEVFAPLADAELDQCASMRFEFLSARNSLDIGIGLMLADGAVAKFVRTLANSQHMLRRFATLTGAYCQAEQHARDVARDPTPPAVVTACTWSGWAFDPVGCALVEDATPDYHGYHLRVFDLDARLRLLNAAIWLRKPVNDGGVQTLLGDPGFAARPKAADSPLHDFTWDAQRGVLRMRNLQAGRGEFWEVPVAKLPPTTEQPQ